jgi:hypothetical protein
MWEKVGQEIGNPTFEILRNPLHRRRIRKPMVRRLRRILIHKLSTLRKENMRSKWTTSRYPKQTTGDGKS